ncbi:MAG: hypothetical protein Q9160_005484 [Pyrenula sp. 1 TL-2023]
MSKALKQAAAEVFGAAAQRASSIKKILNPPCDNSFAGSRVYPARDPQKDKKFGVRLDLGQPVQGKPGMVTLNLQVNADADSRSLQDLVKKYGTHKKFASVTVDTTQAATKENLAKIHNEFQSQVDDIEDL